MFESILEVRRIMSDEIGDGSEIYARTWSTPPPVVPRGVWTSDCSAENTRTVSTTKVIGTTTDDLGNKTTV
jgi:hypothetical protein